jgi:hypothetical protein
MGTETLYAFVEIMVDSMIGFKTGKNISAVLKDVEVNSGCSCGLRGEPCHEEVTAATTMK